MTRTVTLCRFFALFVLWCGALGIARADMQTFTGTFTADDSLFTYNFTTSSVQMFDFYTTSYGGGMNANGTMTAAGGFDPVLTLFSTTTGAVIGFGGGSGMKEGASKADPVTGLYEDANFVKMLAPGAYTLVLSEFPNVPIGTLSGGYLFAGDSTVTGDFCGVSGGKFLQTDQAPCVQRTGNYAVNVVSASAVPEPATWMLVLPAAVGLALVGRRQFA